MDETPTLDIKFERLVAIAIEATVIVVESRLHSDPVPSLRAHRARIVEERDTLYQSYEDIGRPVIDQLLYRYGFRELDRIYHLDTQSIQDAVRRAFAELLFPGAEATTTCSTGSSVPLAGLTLPARALE